MDPNTSNNNPLAPANALPTVPQQQAAQQSEQALQQPGQGQTASSNNPMSAVISMGEEAAGSQQTSPASAQGMPPTATQKPSSGGIKLPPLPEIKPQGPSFFGYRPPKWAHDFEYVRQNKGKGSESETKTWLLYMVDRLLKMHSR